MTSEQIKAIPGSETFERENTGWITGVDITKFFEKYYFRFEDLGRIGYSAEIARNKVERYRYLIISGSITKTHYLDAFENINQAKLKNKDNLIEYSLVNAAIASWAYWRKKGVAWPYLFEAFRWIEFVCLLEARGKPVENGKGKYQTSLDEETENFPVKYYLLTLMEKQPPDSRWKKRSHVGEQFSHQLNEFVSNWEKAGKCELDVGGGKIKTFTQRGRVLDSLGMQNLIPKWICKYDRLCQVYRVYGTDKNCHTCVRYVEGNYTEFGWVEEPLKRIR